ncbi:AMP-dependent synthetase/ligase [Thermospira aquatica]|uniref:AMP-binding protein n=1 Tax=Thermospira aquatica TaxID=2828656 RepID=A0AAX3BDB8_9SPIR|nr:AMP-binding protein [Thermospira aquatica]URA10196.1 AMP-binding protein [Thermospira aquatica]
MEITSLQHLVNYLSIFGRKPVSRMKEGNTYRQYTYYEFVQNVRSVAAYLLRSKRLKKGDMVALYSENRPEWMMAYLGIVYNGVWAVPLDARLSDIEVKNLLLDCGAKYIFTTASLLENVLSEPEVVKQLSEIILFDRVDVPKEIQKKVRYWQDILEEGWSKEHKEHRELVVNPDDVASLIYTSGTTGKPKGVMLTHGNFAAQINALAKAVPLQDTDVLLSVLPLHHTYEFSVELTVLYKGASATYAESLKPNKMFDNIRETGVTVMIGVPLLFEKIYGGIMRQVRNLPFGVKHILMGLYHFTAGLNALTRKKAGKVIFSFLRKKAHLDGIRFAISGAAPLNHKVAKGFEVLGLTLLNGYGLTETSPVVSVNRVGRVNNYSVGEIIDGIEVKIDNPDSEGNGEICVRGPIVMKGYYRNPKATKEVIDKDGWLHTGDMGKLENGYLFVTGRIKNIIVTPGGKNVYPEEIEELINESDFVLESLVLGGPESQHSKGENIYAYVVPNYEFFDTYCNLNNLELTDDLVEQMIDRHMREVNAKLPDYKKIRGFRIRREEFDKTSTRKIKRFLYSGSDFLNT